MQCTGSPLGWTFVNNWAIVQLYSLDASALHTNGTQVLLIHISEAVILARSLDFNLRSIKLDRCMLISLLYLLLSLLHK